MPEQQSNTHTGRTLQLLQDADDEPGIDARDAIKDITADRDTWECAHCGRLFVRRSKAMDCCSDESGGGGE